jgi:death on curing protein
VTVYLTLEDVLGYVERSGWVLRDPGLLDAAIHRPQSSLFGRDAYPTLAEKSAALLHSLAQNQALLDGNKRLAIVCVDVFVNVNDHRVTASEDALFDLMIDLAKGLDDVPEVARRLEILADERSTSAGGLVPRVRAAPVEPAAQKGHSRGGDPVGT